jgi:hypothetical protein
MKKRAIKLSQEEATEVDPKKTGQTRPEQKITHARSRTEGTKTKSFASIEK